MSTTIDTVPEQDVVEPTRTPRPLLAAVGLTAALGAVLVVLLALFILPSLKSGPHDLALGVVGDPSQVGAVTEGLESGQPGAFEVHVFPDVDSLDQAIAQREVVGGYVLGTGAFETHVASAGSTAISGTVAAAGSGIAESVGLPATTTDVVPLPADDPSGIGIGGLAFPLVFGGIVPVVAFASLFKGSHAWRIGGIAAFSVVGGLLVSAVLQLWFGSIEDAFWPVAGAMALGIAGLALPLSGLQQVLGSKGFTAGAMVMMFLGNPLAGISTTGAWLPSGLGAFGQALPPGATGSLVRAVAYFDGAGAGSGLATLLVWLVAGVALNLVAVARGRRTPDTARA